MKHSNSMLRHDHVLVQECVREVKTKLLPTTLDAFKIWPAANMVNFSLVPSNLRILYISVISVRTISSNALSLWMSVDCLVSIPDWKHTGESSRDQLNQ